MLQRWLLTLLAGESLLALWLIGKLAADGRAHLFIVITILLIAFCWRLSHALASFVVTESFRLRGHRPSPLRETLRALLGEFTSRLISFNWSQAFPQWALGADPVGPVGGMPILLVHGYFSNRGLWIRFRKRLAAAGKGPVYTITLEPLMGSIDAMMPALAARIDEICRETGKERLIVVAHSMGGLVTRAYMVAHGCGRIAQFITLGTPHHGTATAGFGLGACTQQMRIGSTWLRTLVEGEKGEEGRPATLSIYTLTDDIVYPPETCILEWASNVPISGVGHVQLLFSEAVAQRVIENIRQS